MRLPRQQDKPASSGFELVRERSSDFLSDEPYQAPVESTPPREMSGLDHREFFVGHATAQFLEFVRPRTGVSLKIVVRTGSCDFGRQDTVKHVRLRVVEIVAQNRHGGNTIHDLHAQHADDVVSIEQQLVVQNAAAGTLGMKQRGEPRVVVGILAEVQPVVQVGNPSRLFLVQLYARSPRKPQFLTEVLVSQYLPSLDSRVGFDRFERKQQHVASKHWFEPALGQRVVIA